MAGSTIRQSFCSALQAEVAEFYRLMAVLQEQSMREAPKPGNLSAGRNYLASYISVQMLLGSILPCVPSALVPRRLACLIRALQSWYCIPDKRHFSSWHGWVFLHFVCKQSQTSLSSCNWISICEGFQQALALQGTHTLRRCCWAQLVAACFIHGVESELGVVQLMLHLGATSHFAGLWYGWQSLWYA